MELSCGDVRRRCSEYLDGDLSGRMAEAVRRHLAACRGCSAFAGTLRRTVDLSRRLPAISVPAEVRRELKALVRRRRARGGSGPSRRRRTGRAG